MASGAFVNPKTLLLVTPLVTSTCSLWCSSDQDYFLKILTRPAFERTQANAIIPTYIKTMFGSGPWRVVALIAITTWSSIANIVLLKPLLRSHGALNWYAWGAVMAAGHLAYVPAVAWKLKWIMEDSTEEQGTDNVGMLGRWLRVNNIRTFTVDLAAFACSLVAVTKMITI
ncbi:Fc.00g050280.m01.CDS01 [Cosmosporella sp. VM-42]